MCSAGRRNELMKYFHKSAEPGSKIVAADNSPYAPALYFADKQYIVPRIDAPEYVDVLLEICKKEEIQGVTTLIDPEIEILAKNRERFSEHGVVVFAPYEETARLCFDKYKMFQFLRENGIPTVETWDSLDEFAEARKEYPVFVKPRTGSGSVGARRIDSYEELKKAMQADSSLIIQEFMDGLDLDADVYVDTITHRAAAAFLKRKIETKIGGASKTVSFKDQTLFDFIQRIVAAFQFNGPIDMDFFYRDGKYYLSEVNPRFGGGYLHTYGAGIDFIQMMERNLSGMENTPVFGNYEEGSVMMMYDSVVICKKEELLHADCYSLG